MSVYLYQLFEIFKARNAKQQLNNQVKNNFMNFFDIITVKF